jgi:hypothetical protein
MKLKGASGGYSDRLRCFTLEAIQYLASCCDGAVERDGMGFNQDDTWLGHALASESKLSDIDMPDALRLCRIYKGQLIDVGLDPWDRMKQ